MFGGFAFSEESFSTQDHVAADASAFAAFLAQVDVERVLLVEVDALSLAASGAASGAFSAAGFGEVGFGDDSAGVTGGAVTLTWSSHGYISQAGDTPASNYYDSRVKSDVLVERAIIGRGGVGGLSRALAEAGLTNGDGALDTLADDYALDGRPCRILVGRMTDARAAFGTLFSGVIETVTTAAQGATSAATLRLRLSDGLARLQVPVQSSRYLGTGGVEGGADLKGKPKPRCFGKVFNSTPPLVDSVNLIYQVNGAAINDVSAVRDRGVALTKVPGAPAAGQYQVTVATGTFKLGATPAGTITCDVEGDASSAGYITRTGDILVRLLSTTLTTSEIDTTSFAMLNQDQPAPVGIWIGAEERTLSDVIDELLAGIGAFGGFSRTGMFSVGRVAAPSGAAVAAFTETSIMSIEREAMPAGLDPLAWQVRVGYQKNYTVQADVAVGATEAARTFAAQPYRISARSDVAIQSRRLLAREYDVESLMRDVADADAESQRVFDLWSIARAPFRVALPLAALTCDVGQVVNLTYPRHRLSAGRDTRVIGYRVSWPRVELRVIP